MSKTKLSITVFSLILLCISKTSWGQQSKIDPFFYQIFDKDSLSGFDENAARASAISENFTGAEFPIRMYRLKREYINNKYNLTKPFVSNTENWLLASRPAAVPGCVNEDFEASTAAAITVSNQISGWTVVAGYNGYVSSSSAPSLTAYFPGGLTNANTCNLLGCCPMPPSESALIDCSAPGGYIDNVIGSSYPIFSVFGSGPTNTLAATTNTQITGGMFGTKVIRINNTINDYSIEKLSKTFAVTSSNALFQFAFISIFATGHSCCDAGAFQIKLTNATTNSTIPCPTFSVSAPSTGGCTGGTGTPNYLVIPSNVPYNGSNGSYIYNPWKINSIDLSPYIGQNITIDILSSDCDAGGHYGCVYFDAQCGPMTVYGNGNPYDAGTNVTIPTCGAAGATICAANGLGPYSWGGPGLTTNQTVPSMTNQCITASVSAQFTLYMQPQGSCIPIQRVVNSTITPAPLLSASALQATCGSSLAIVSVTPSGSAANPSSLSWSPTPLSLNSSTTAGTYTLPVGQNSINVSITGTDPLGCRVTATVNVNPAPPIPTFSIVNTTNSNSITCDYPTINLTAASNYSYNNGSLHYFWASASTTFSANNVAIVNPGTYTVIGSDSITNCGITHLVTIGVNTIAPTSVISPSFQNITCNLTSIQLVTVTANPTVNITHQILAPQGGTFSSTSYSTSYMPGGIGNFTYCLKNNINGCVTCKNFTVTSSQGFPTFSVVSAQNFTLGCNTTSCSIVNITQGNTSLPQGGSVSYTILPPSASSVTPSGSLSPINTYTICSPGTYTVITKDNTSFCETRVPISILQNTFTPDISAIVDRQILDCNNSRVTLRGQSITNNINYLWNFQGTPNTQQGDTITVLTDFSSATKTLVNTYTLIITDNSSTCKSTSVIPIYQNLFPPKPVVTNGGISAISCSTRSLVLTNQSSTSIPPATGFPSNLPVISSWEGPTPQDPLDNSTSYNALTVGIYTMTVKDLNNGCTNSATIAIADNRVYPLINNPTSPPTPVLDCGSKQVAVSPFVTNATTGGLSYAWTTPPGATVTGVNSPTLFTNQPGEYGVIVTNTLNGCATPGSMDVINGKLTAGFEPDQITGYAPLTVNFINNSSSTTGNSSIISVWNFGNGTSLQQTSVETASSLFTQPGTYTITLYATKGTCLDTVHKVITLDIPSSMEIPNVFTPNGDGANDLFFIKATNLAEINAVIFDRWGHKVYELTTDKGGIEWDGKNQLGKDAAEGTYFYIIKATGKDNTSYNKKGTINLYR